MKKEEKRILVIEPGKKAKTMSMEKACREYSLTEKQINHAIETGHYLKTMFFDEAID